MQLNSCSLQMEVQEPHCVEYIAIGAKGVPEALPVAGKGANGTQNEPV